MKHARSFTGSDEDAKYGCCSYLLIVFSYLLVILALPCSLIWTIKVVQEYERAVIFRLGRIASGSCWH